MKKTARFVKDIIGWTGNAKLYRVDPPIDDSPHVIVSATVAPFSGPETYIFAASGEGRVISWGELTGSYRGGLDHAVALAGAGYEIVP